MASNEQIGAIGQADQTASAAAASSCSGVSRSSSPPAAPPSLSLAQRCYTDALTSVFAYLKLRELSPIVQTCRSCSAAAAQEPSRSLSLELRWDRPLDQLCSGSPSSALGHHVTGLQTGRIKLDQLRAVRSLLALTSLDVGLQAEEVAARGAEWTLRASLPPRLRSLTVRLPAYMKKGIGPYALKAVFAAISAAPDLETFVFRSSTQQLAASTSLHSLEQLPHLTELNLSMTLLAGHLAAIKQLSSLRQLSVHGGQWTVAELSALCSPPHRLQQLEEIDLSRTDVGSAHMAELLKLPGLTSLRARALDPAAVSLLPQLQQLRTVRLNSDLLHSETGRSQLCATLRQCASLTCLHLQQEIATLGDAALQELFAAVPGLRAVQVEHTRMRSLRFLSLAAQVEELELARCTQITPTDLAELGTLTPQLRVLRVHQCNRLQLDNGKLRELLQPPGSNRLPDLTCFDYSSGEDDFDRERDDWLWGDAESDSERHDSDSEYYYSD